MWRSKQIIIIIIIIIITAAFLRPYSTPLGPTPQFGVTQH